MIYPDQHNHLDQTYVLTEIGVALKACRAKGEAKTSIQDQTNGG